jgi:peptidoglycan hydrolase-like protein with peptidoglycan-binding domain
MPATFSRGVKGDLVLLLQHGLAAKGLYTSALDADFGGATAKAVQALQTLAQRSPTGLVAEVDWQDATGLAWPEHFERCLQLVARFEGHGYGTIAGNFDGAGLTWGIIGFTLKHGELRTLILELAARAPGVLDSAFGSDATELLTRLRDNSATQQLAWATSISLPPNKVRVAEPWRSGFMRLGAEPLVREMQRRAARRAYYEPAVATAARLGLTSERGIALCFDVHVQNGGVKAASAATYANEVAKLPAGTAEVEKRRLLARLVAASSKPKYRADVLARKECIAVGAGTVHGEAFDVDAWALADG